MTRSVKAVARQERRAKRREDRVVSRSRAEQQPHVEAPRSKANFDPVHPLTKAQVAYDRAMTDRLVIFGVGAAGTGKTWLPAVRAADLLREKKIERIVLTRPAVEAGEKLGFMPGDLMEKYAHYIAPFLDAFEERLGKGHLEAYLRNGRIKPVPLAFMRGLTLKNSWVLADEAQNMTPAQMKMLLTRVGKESKMVISGDPDQSDLPGTDGLTDAIRRLHGDAEIEVVRFARSDVVRHDIVARILRAYEKSD